MNMFRLFDPNEIIPEGWLKTQLEIQAKGLMGNLDKVWPDVRDSAWVGGNRDGWERVPYWLDGFIPLAYLLRDEDMIGRVERYVNGILERQRPDGWICPCKEEDIPKYDLWALLLIGKVLALYCEFTGSEKAENALYRALHNLKDLLDAGTVRLRDWGHYRWFEGLIPIEFLYRKHREDWLLSLASTLKEQGAKYESFTDRWIVPLNVWTMETHIVNLTMMLKTEAVEKALFGKSTISASAEDAILKKYNGTAVGLYTGDECLAGISNVQGTELCSVNELMYSLEWLYRVTGESKWADRLETVAFNALPATYSDDMWTHQYLQMANQIECSYFPNKAIFRTNGGESNLFGLEPNYGCCTANGGQGWPKFAMNAFFRDGENGIRIPVLMPASLNTVMNGKKVTLRVVTEYPFRHSAKLIAQAEEGTEINVTVRVPDWAESITVNGNKLEKTKSVTLKISGGKTEYDIVYLSEPRMNQRPHGLKTASWGPLVFSLPRKAEWVRHEFERNGVERKYPYCDYELKSEDEWRFGFAGEELYVDFPESDGFPFSSSHPRVVLKAKMVPINWGYAEGYTTVSDPFPKRCRATGEPNNKTLIPYGCAKLRVTEIPYIK